MLYGIEWLNNETMFPPKEEQTRLDEYTHFAELFDLKSFENFNETGRRLFINFDDYFNLPLFLGYQRLTTIKTCDMVIGSPPSITVNDNDAMTDKISNIRDETDFDVKTYQALIDYSRYGVAVYRLFNDDEVIEEDKGNFVVWDPREWFPILKKDGTKRIKEHVLAWRVNFGTEINPDWYLEVQRHPIEGGKYFEERYRMDPGGKYIQKKMYSKTVDTGDMPCLVQHIANLPTSSNIYGTSDYKIINELVTKATERMRQILHILDKHADPSMTGPATMLETNDAGELEFRAAQFYCVSPGEEHPEYMTWDGQLEAAFKALEFLLNQIHVMSEMGAALYGNVDGNGVAVSGTAMRYKMVSPLEKSRRVQNSFTLPIKKLVSGLVQISLGQKMKYQDINVIWQDSLPKDPRELVELTRLQTGAPQIMPLKHALMENYDMDTEDALHYIEEIEKEQEKWSKIHAASTARPGEKDNPSAPPNPRKKGSINEPKNTSTASVNDKREDSR